MSARRITAVLAAALLVACGQSGREAEEMVSRLSLGPGIGAICGNPDILGVEIPDIDAGGGGCGIDDPVEVHAVAGVRLSEPAHVTCETANALGTWVRAAARPVARELGSELDRLKVAGHYACRTRNHVPGARLSEHARGMAIDISALVLADGQALSVLDGWKTAAHGAALRKLHGAACGPFGTVLGPDSDRHHRDHFHFDTASYRSGAYCR
jgi:hypothetical protein